MSTEFDVAKEIEETCFLGIIEFLERNDFTHIKRVNNRTIQAKDGSRLVYLWIEYRTDPRVRQVAVPGLLIQLARHDHARVDVIRVDIDDIENKDAKLRHFLNAIPRP